MMMMGQWKSKDTDMDPFIQPDNYDSSSSSFVLLSCRRFDAGLVKRHHITVLEQAVDVYSNEFIRFITFLRNNDDFKEISVAAGSSHEVEYINPSGQKTVVRCKVDCIPPVVEPAESRSEVEG
ncbi:unnamed protein product [Linum tenue]|uniref:Uncharacterized protein n=1 Tax=Linum tenue TaxID=586396 RepID=A0AAV0Q4Q3_9ROSI|nr:unnamed protein product [Linum tenue]